LRVSPGEYPTISITDLGERVMREQERIQLALTNDGRAKDFGVRFPDEGALWKEHAGRHVTRLGG